MSLLTQICLQVPALSKSQPLFWKVWISDTFGLLCPVPVFGVSAVTVPPLPPATQRVGVLGGTSEAEQQRYMPPLMVSSCHKPVPPGA